jgi:excisionase family DNA binding protein
MIIRSNEELGKLGFSSSSKQHNGYLSLEETAIYLGLSKSTLYKLTSQRVIPFFTPTGRKILFSKDDLDNWVSSNRKATILELQNEPISSTKRKGDL